MISAGPLFAAHIATDPPTARARLIALRIATPTAWRAIVAETMRAAAAAGAGKPEAAALLGVSERGLYKWIDEDDELTALAQSLALPGPGGRGHRPRERPPKT